MAGLGAMGGGLDVLVRFIGDSSKLKNEVAKIDSTGGRIKGWAKGVGGAVAGAFAVGAVAAFGKASVDAALESEVATNRLENVFKSMGDTTGKAAKEAEKFAGALSRKTGIDDEAIMSSQALLATFGKVSSETGRQAGIFDRATAAAADLSKAGFGDMDSTAKQLGKALQDPVKGISALGRAGVTFTAAQKKQIKAMVEAGDTLGAQKIVLGEVEHQVKGTAEATATSADKMNVAWGETQESVGKALLPVLEKLAPVLDKIATFIQKNITWLLPLAIALGVLAVAMKLAALANTLFGTSMLAALGPILIVIAAIAALIAIGYLIVRNWDSIKKAAAAVWSFMQKVWDKILGAMQGVFNWIRKNWPTLLAILTGPIGIAVLLIVKNWDRIKAVIVGVFNWIRHNWPLLLAILTGPIGVAVLLIVKNWDKIKAAVSAAFDFIKRVWSRIAAILRAPFDAASSVISGIIHHIKDMIGSAFDFIAGVVGRVKTTISSIFDAARGVGEQIANMIKGPINVMIRGFNKIPFAPDIPELARGGTVMRTGLAVVHEGEQFSGVGRTFGPTSPSVWIEHLEVAETLDVELFMRKAAWAVQRERI
jgi:phage-related protein